MALVRAHPRGSTGSVLVEASGGVNLENVAAYARAGADVISVGALTHSVMALDIGLDLENVTLARELTWLCQRHLVSARRARSVSRRAR